MSERISDSRLEHLLKCVSADNFSSVGIPRVELEELVTVYQLSQVRAFTTVDTPLAESVNCMCVQNTAGERIANPLCLAFHLTAAVQVMEKPVAKEYSFSEVLKILSNMGHDTECGACMSVAFTGASATNEHTCKQASDPHDETEPLFTLRGQDWIAPEIIREWAYRSLKLGSPIDKVDGARRIADAMENWQITNDKRKVAD